jgi:hypothetical protein
MPHELGLLFQPRDIGVVWRRRESKDVVVEVVRLDLRRVALETASDLRLVDRRTL